jgi:hypothetical protein
MARKLRYILLAATVASCMLIFVSEARAIALNACDLNADGVVDPSDVQLARNMALGLVPCTAQIAGSGVCNVIVVQRITNAALNGPCVTGVTGAAHSVTLSWTASTSSNLTGYYLYRSTQVGGPYTKLTASAVAGTTYTDMTVQAGGTYYYVATAVDGSGNESVFSNQASAVIPVP